MSQYNRILHLLDALPFRFPLQLKGVQIYRVNAETYELDGEQLRQHHAAVLLLERRIELKAKCRGAAFLEALEN